uniref:Dehydrin n=1 Tax=Salix viminalis TaxID=40686 RepID=A0A6N2NGS8_SALVM
MAGILHKIEGAFGGKKEEQGKGEPHAGQQGHNPQGGYGQQGHNAQGERKEGFADKFKDKIPGMGGSGGAGGGGEKKKKDKKDRKKKSDGGHSSSSDSD